MALWQGSSMNTSEYAAYHVSYISNNTGTSAFHVFCCIFYMAICTINNAIKGPKSGPPNVVVEYLSIVLPLIITHTILADYLYSIIGIVSLLTIVKYKKTIFNKIIVLDQFPKLNYFNNQIETISCLRGLTYLITVFAILAVDFRAFPKSFAKTERFGYSLMDTGVGLFTLMSGLVHKDLRKYKASRILVSNIKFVCVLVTLGITRYWTVRALNYHEHVTEYGVHWNFFFTVAVCKSLSTILLYISNHPLPLAILTLAIHECALSNGIQEWVFSDTPRTDLISANREGIASCLGYTALYLFAVYCKNLISDQSIERYKILGKLVSRSTFCWLMLVVLNMSYPISRVLANSAYCMYLCAIFLSITLLIYSVESLCQGKGKLVYFRAPYILTAINENGLVYFLLGNVFTGIVNLSIQTLFVSNLWSVVILNAYMIVTLGFVVYLKKKGFKI